MRTFYFLDPDELNLPPEWLLREDSGHEEPSWIEKILSKQGNVEIKRISIKDLETIGDKFWFLDFEFAVWNAESIFKVNDGFFELLPPIVIDKLKNGNGRLLLSNCHEGETYDAYNFIYNYLIYNKIRLEEYKVYYATSSLTLKSTHNKFCNEKNIRAGRQIKLIQSYTWEDPYSYDGGLDFENIKPTDLKNRNKIFLNFNRRIRGHRILFGCLLEHHNVIEKGYMSFFLKDDCSNSVDRYRTMMLYKDELKHIIDDNIYRFKSKLPLILDKKDGTINYALDPAIEYYKNSYFSLISSSVFEAHYNTVQMNEKIFKPILFKHPFIVQGTPRFLKGLKKYGYKTFSQWIDESYDNEEDDVKRALMIAKEVKRLCDLSIKEWDKMIEEMEPVIEHNFARIRNKSIPYSRSGLRHIMELGNE